MSTAVVTRISAQEGGTIRAFVKPARQIVLPRLGLLRPGDEVYLTEEEYADSGVRGAVVTAEDIAIRQEEEAMQEAMNQDNFRKVLLGEEEKEEGD